MQESEGDMSKDADIDKLPFDEYARIEAERGAAKYGSPDTPKLSFDQIVASDLTFREIEAGYGEETAINAGIARDPDTWELTEEDFARMRPASEVIPEIVEARKQGRIKLPDDYEPILRKEERIGVWIEADLVEHYKAKYPEDWRNRLNDALRRATFRVKSTATRANSGEHLRSRWGLRGSRVRGGRGRYSRRRLRPLSSVRRS